VLDALPEETATTFHQWVALNVRLSQNLLK